MDNEEPVREELFRKLEARHAAQRARMREIFRRAQERTGPGVTDAEIAAEIEHLRQRLWRRNRTNGMSPRAGAKSLRANADSENRRGGAR